MFLETNYMFDVIINSYAYVHKISFEKADGYIIMSSWRN